MEQEHSSDAADQPKKPQKKAPKQPAKNAPKKAEAESEEDEFDLSDITHNPEEPSREDIIAAAEAAAFKEMSA